MIPVKYNIRNLRARWTSTLLTILSTGMVVFASALLFGLVAGLQHSLTISGDPDDLLVMRKGSTNETDGGFETDKADALLTLDGIARDQEGRLLAARELIHIPVVPRLDGSRANLILRGVEEVSPQLRPDFQIVEGRMFTPGTGECIVSRSLSRRFQGAQIGGLLRTGEKESYKVVGLFTAGGSSAESEVWLARKDLERNIAREGSVSSVQIRAASAGDREQLLRTIAEDTRFRLKPLRESDYFAAQTNTSNFLKVSGTLIAVFLTIGAMFAAANTMFAAVSARTREIGTLRALGFPRSSILVSFLGESVILCTLGGLLGILATLPLNALTFSTMNADTFSEASFSFRFGSLVLIVAFVMTLAMGVLGGLFPALRAVRLDVIKALREL